MFVQVQRKWTSKIVNITVKKQQQQQKQFSIDHNFIDHGNDV